MSTNITSKLDTIRDAIIRVGDWRGFIVKCGYRQLAITAAHCLPHFPPCCSASYLEERTYQELLGPISAPEPKVWAECLFADPVAGVAVLGSPDNQELWDEAEAYEALTEEKAIQVGEAAPEQSVWLLELDGRWQRVVAKHHDPSASASCPNAPLWLEAKLAWIQAGMSGSPIFTEDAVAVGVVAIGASGGLHGPNPRLPYHLPGWFLRQIVG